MQFFKSITSLIAAAMLSVQLLCSFNGELAAAEPWNTQGVIASLKLGYGGGLLLVPINIGGKEFSFVLDTGFTDTILDKSLTSRLERTAGETVLRTLGSKITLPRFKAPELMIGGFPCPNISEVLGEDLMAYEGYIGQRIYGILGMDVLHQFVLHLDFDSDLLLFCDPAKCATPPGRRVPMLLNDENCPCIVGQLRGPAWETFLVDTGFTGTGALKTDRLAFLKRTHELSFTGMYESCISADKAKSLEPLYRLNELKIGQLAYSNLVISPSSKSILGLAFLCRHRTTFDFSKATLFLEDGLLVGVQDRGDYDGIELGDNRLIRSLEPGSAGDKAGLRANDRILAINGIDAASLSIASINRKLRLLRTMPLQLMLLRDGKEKEVLIGANSSDDR